MTLTLTVAVDCCLLIPGTVIKQYLKTITLCVFFYVITIITIIMLMMMMIIIIIMTTISPHSFDKYG